MWHSDLIKVGNTLDFDLSAFSIPACSSDFNFENGSKAKIQVEICARSIYYHFSFIGSVLYDQCL